MRDDGQARGASYEAFYGLLEAPFSLAPGVRFPFMSRSHRKAMEEIGRALERREGFVVITGEIGTGKTMLCRAIAAERDANTHVAMVADPCLTAEEMLTNVLGDFGLMDRIDRAADRHQLMLAFQRFLASLAATGGRAIVIIDEAHHLHPAVIEAIRLWANLDSSKGGGHLQIILSGQPELDEVLGRPELRQFVQRVSRRCELTRLGMDEVAQYLEHRLSVARGDAGRKVERQGGLRPGEFWRVRFTAPAARRVAALTHGIPRLVNLLADRALEVGHERQAREIDGRSVREAGRRLHLLAPALPRYAVPAAVAAAIVLLLGGTWAAWQALAGWSVTVPVSAEATAPQPLPVGDSVSVTIASFRTEQRANAVAAQLVDAGFPAFTRHDPARASHQVIVGPYVSAEEAQAAQTAMRTHGVTESEVSIQRLAALEVGP